jgi:hypothetical protein
MRFCGSEIACVNAPCIYVILKLLASVHHAFMLF